MVWLLHSPARHAGQPPPHREDRSLQANRLVAPLLFLALSAGAPARADDQGETPIELRSGDEVEVRVDARGHVTIVRTPAHGEGEPEEFALKAGEKISFEVSDALPAEESAKVLKVLDGDTIVIELRGAEERVRLLGVDTPEIFGDFYAVEAWEKTKTLVEGKTVRLVYDQRRVEDLGRILCYIYVGKVCVNAQLLAGGYARMPDRTDQLLLRQYEEFRRLEESARTRKLGIWNEEAARAWETQFKREDHYISSKTTFHRPTCSHAEGLLDPATYKTVEAALSAHKTPCTKCLPTRNYEPAEEND